ncbi:MAG: hypothetical protein PF447_12065, partial [Spirochaetaceae bacterium]|nr:hypothetical protein [Spirochaetaceae bacterium]
QHLVNYAERNGLNGSGLDLGYIDTWINEGLSLGAEYLYSGEYDQSWLAFFYGYYEGSGPGSDFHPPEDSILRGENFFIWEDSDDPDHDLLADYCTAYHFFQWLRIQAGSNEIYSDIFDSSDTDYSDVLSSYISRIKGGNSIEWYELLQNWYLAMALNQDTGLYGFEDEMGFSDSTLNWVYKENETVDPPLEEAPLRPGEAILDSIDTTFTPGSSESGDIHYLSIDSNSSDGSVNKDGPSYVGDYILVLNGSTVASDDELTVAISASTLPVSISTSLESLAGARSITSTTTRPPYRTDRIISP